MAAFTPSRTAASEKPGDTLARNVTWRRRFRRLICAGPLPDSSVTTSARGTEPSFTDDPNLSYLAPANGQVNQYSLRADGGLLQINEDPLNPGRYYSTYAREFGTHAARTGGFLGFGGERISEKEQVFLDELAAAFEIPTETE